MSGKTWWGNLAVLTMMLATLCVVNVSLAIAHTDPYTPAPICEQVKCDDLCEMRLEHVTSFIVASRVRPVPFSPAVITLLHLPPVIFQPPETA